MHSVEGGLWQLPNQYRGAQHELSNQKRRLMERKFLTGHLSTCLAIVVLSCQVRESRAAVQGPWLFDFQRQSVPKSLRKPGAQTW